jgi:hypothetical protein
MLHSDDKLIPLVFERYLSIIENDPAMIFYSGIEFHDVSGKRVRSWDSGKFSRLKLNTGWMPPHTSMIVAKSVYQKLGSYDPDFGTAADYEWIVRVLSEYGENSRYFPQRTLTMLVGGASSESLQARLRANAMDGKVWERKSWLQSMVIRLLKPMRKLRIFQKSGYYSLDLAQKQADLYRLAGPDETTEGMRVPLGKSGKDIIYTKKVDNGEDMLGAELDAFLEAVIENKPVAVTVEEATEALRVALEVKRIGLESIEKILTGGSA